MMPKSWTQSIIAPIGKKGGIKLPGNYRPISLLLVRSISAICLIIYFLGITNQNIIGTEEMGFLTGKKSTLNHFLVLSHLTDKQVKNTEIKVW